MGKIVKYCSSCDEGFGERFTFCPVCGASLQAFEMNPVTGKAEAPPSTAPETTSEAPREEFITSAAEAPIAASETFEPAVEEPVQAAAAEDIKVDHEYDDTRYDYRGVDEAPVYAASTAPLIDDGYRITVIEEKNGKQRNGLLLGISVVMISFVALATVYSLFSKALDVDAIGDGTSLAMLLDDVPMPTEDKPEIKDKKDAGGGGGGGREEKTPATLGDLANQTQHPIRPPDATVPRLDNPALVLPPASTQGNMKFPPKYDRYGLPNGLDGPASNGIGSGGGLGNGFGTGQGNGSGSGAGNGNGAGYGNGNGNGNGNGTGNGNGGGPPPPAAMAVTSPYHIISKPKASYTDAARSNNVQGTVRLKVTLLASGQVGGVSPITQLPYGLTEQAIAAAKQIKFEPKKVNGVAVPTIVTVEYNFNIY